MHIFIYFAFLPMLLASTAAFADATELPPITDDSAFIDVHPSHNIRWSVAGSRVSDIESAFNHARLKDPTITRLLKMPTQEVWDAMDIQEKALFLLNRERYDRGIKPFEGIDERVVAVAEAYAAHLHDSGTFGHNEKSTPWRRLDGVAEIHANRNFFRYAENLYAFGSSVDHIATPIARAVYSWIYADAGSLWGHRDFCLASGLVDDSGVTGAEGLIGLGMIQSDDYPLYNGRKSTLIVMNAFDPSSTWDHTPTRRVSLGETAPKHIALREESGFMIDDGAGLISDTQRSLMWQNAEIAFGKQSTAKSVCDSLDYAGYTDWRVPTEEESQAFHYALYRGGIVPGQCFAHCTAEVAGEGHVRTRRGSAAYGKKPGDPIRFAGNASIRCVRAFTPR